MDISTWSCEPGFTTLRVAIDAASRCGVVELARPSKLNSLSVASWEELPRAAALLSAREDIQVVVLQGEGKHFCAGIDAEMLFNIASSTERGCPMRARQGLLQTIRQMQDSFTAFERCRWPVIAAIQGACIGAGINLVAACDIRVAAADASFCVKEIDLGITADIGILQRLGPIVGHGIASEWSLTARKVPAREALQRGMVSECFPSHADLASGVSRLVEKLAAKPMPSLLGTKRVLLHARDHSVDEGLDYVATWNSAFLPSRDLNAALAKLKAGMAKGRSKL